MALELVMAGMGNFNFIEGEETDFEEKDDSEDEREDSDYDDNKDDTDFEDLLSQNEDTEVLSLQNLCLKSIIINFERFNTAYLTSEDSALRRNLLFLQRAYPDHMIKEMEGCILDSNMNFLVHEHLKELRLESLCNCTEELILKRLSEIGHGFEKGHLTCTGHDFPYDSSPSVKKVVPLLPNLQVLQIPFSCDDDILELIASSCPKLQELHIDDSKVTFDGLKSLFVERGDAAQAKCQLKVLSLKNTNVTPLCLGKLLENIPTLQILNHSLLPLVFYNMHKNDLKNSAKKTVREYHITSLDLMNYDQFSGVEISDILAACAKMCPHVTSLCSPVMNEKDDLRLIALFPKLENLSLDAFSSTTLNLNDFLKKKGENVKELKLSYFSLSVVTLLQSCPKLESLNLRDISFERNESCAPIASYLRKLSLEHFSFTEPTIQKSIAALLNASPELELLDMAHCEFDNSEMHAALSSYCANCVLQELNFRCSDVNAILLESILLTCTTLRTLLIHDCENIFSDNIDSLYEINHSKKNKVNIVWNDDRSEFNSMDDDFFDNDFADDSDDYYYADYEYNFPSDFDGDYGSDY